MDTPDLDRLLSPEYVSDLESLSLDEVRRRRVECTEVETGLSYVRRLVQGRLEIVLAESQRRRAGEGRGDLSDLVEQLKRGEILGDKLRGGPGPGRLPTFMAPADASGGGLTAELDAIAGAATVSNLPDLADDAVDKLVGDLTELERQVSDRRRAIFDRIDTFQAEIVRRYTTGQANVDDLLDQGDDAAAGA